MRANEIAHDLVLHKYSQGWRPQIQQPDEEQRPGHGGTCGRHRGNREIAREQVRQPRSADHQAKHQRQKIAPTFLIGLLLGRRAMWIPRERLALQRHAAQRLGPLIGLVQLTAPELARRRLVLGHGGQLPAGGHDGADIATAGAQLADMLAQCLAFGRQHIGHIAQLGLQHLSAGAIGLQHRLLGL